LPNVRLIIPRRGRGRLCDFLYEPVEEIDGKLIYEVDDRDLEGIISSLDASIIEYEVER